MTALEIATVECQLQYKPELEDASSTYADGIQQVCIPSIPTKRRRHTTPLLLSIRRSVRPIIIICIIFITIIDVN